MTGYIIHSGVKGMKWGVRNGPPYPIKSNARTIQKIYNGMRSIKYAEFTRLMSADEVARKKKGSCHDQVMYELRELRNAGYSPKATFFMDVDPKSGKGYQTHSFVHYDDPETGKHVWLEHAWQEEAGIHVYDSEKAMRDDIKIKHKVPAGIKTYYGPFDDSKLKPGMDLQELVDICLK